jgi:hypothetical protein
MKVELGESAIGEIGGREETSVSSSPLVRSGVTYAVTYELEKWSGRLDSNQRPPAPKAKEPTQLGAAGNRCPSFSLGNFQLGATAGNHEPLPIVSQLSANG